LLIERDSGLKAHASLLLEPHSFHVGLPPNVQADILRRVGFSEAAIGQILLGGGGLTYKLYEALRASGPHVDRLLEEWRLKLDVLQRDGCHIGISSCLDTLKVKLGNCFLFTNCRELLKIRGSRTVGSCGHFEGSCWLSHIFWKGES